MGFMKCKRKLYHAEVMRRRANPIEAWNARSEKRARSVDLDADLERYISRLHPRSSWALVDEASKYVLGGHVVQLVQPL